jgi:hypothetical protein
MFSLRKWPISPGRLGRERLVSISHATERNEQVVTVWFWSDVPPPVAQKAETGRGFEVIVKDSQEES